MSKNELKPNSLKEEIIILLKEKSELLQAEITEILGKQQPYISRVLTQLEKDGIIVRRKANTKANGKIVKLENSNITLEDYRDRESFINPVDKLSQDYLELKEQNEELLALVSNLIRQSKERDEKIQELQKKVGTLGELILKEENIVQENQKIEDTTTSPDVFN